MSDEQVGAKYECSVEEFKLLNFYLAVKMPKNSTFESDVPKFRFSPFLLAHIVLLMGRGGNLINLRDQRKGEQREKRKEERGKKG
jgi:hypothetical protein